jgi:hypothetical protein
MIVDWESSHDISESNHVQYDDPYIVKTDPMLKSIDGNWMVDGITSIY